MKILAFAATNSKKSINKKLLTYATGLMDGVSVELIDLNDYELPLFGEDKEAEIGQPSLAADFLAKIEQSDALVISFAEHNGSYTVAYKNIFDWASRINPKVFQNKPMIMLATSPGAGGASNVLNAAITSAPHFNGQVKGSLSVPRFYDNFDSEKNMISNVEVNDQLISVMNILF